MDDTAASPVDNNPRNTRLRANLNFRNPLIAVNSAKFKLPRSMAESNNGDRKKKQNGNVTLKKVKFNVDLEQNYSNLKESLNGRSTDVKKEEIVGPTGTVRGFKNIIKERQVNFGKLNGEIEVSLFKRFSSSGFRNVVNNSEVRLELNNTSHFHRTR